MLYIRTDANDKIATGHVMRCSAIAEQLQKMGEKIIFIAADEKSQNFIENQGYQCINIHSKWNDLESEIDKMRQLISEKRINKILIDSYYITVKYMDALNKMVKIIYIDDLGTNQYSCDILINYSIYYSDIQYQMKYKGTQLLLGCDYVPLRPPFSGLEPKNIKNQVETVLILTGGTDQYSFALNFISNIAIKNENIIFEIICGIYNKDLPQIKEVIYEKNNIKIFTNVRNIEEHMQKADIAISAGGTSLYELCACATPTISYSFADNQLHNVKAFAKRKIIPYSGDLRRSYSYEKLQEMMDSLVNEPMQRSIISQTMKHCAGGEGAKRIAEIIHEIKI